jgi:hypothetical protein
MCFLSFQVGWSSLKKIICKPNPLFVNTTCRVRPLSRSSKNVTVIAIVFEPQLEFMVSICVFFLFNTKNHLFRVICLNFSLESAQSNINFSLESARSQNSSKFY